MPQFILFCRDKPDSLPLRQATRPAHLDYIAGNMAAILLAGPMLDDKGDPAGSMLIIEATDQAAAQAFAANDPYALAGLFAEVSVTPYRIVTGSLATTK